MNKKKKLTNKIRNALNQSEGKTYLIPLSIGVLVFSFALVFLAFAWDEPTQGPPNGNVAAPINVGDTGQDKEGSLGIEIPDGDGHDPTYGLTVGTASNPLGIKAGGNSRIEGTLQTDDITYLGGGDFNIHSASGALRLDNDGGTRLYIGTNGAISIPNLVSCDTIDTNASGLLSCGSDDAGSGSLWAQVVNGIYYNDGNVGIGTVTPNYPLHVQVADGATLMFEDTGTANPARIVLKNANGEWEIRQNSGSHSLTIDDNTNSRIAMNIYDDGNISLAPVAGNVGIGDATPSYKLDVAGTIRATGPIYSYYGNIGNLNTTLDIGQSLEYGNADVATLRFDSDRWRLYAGGDGGGNEIFTVQQGGNIGIGTTNPGIYKLNVNGNINATQLCIATDCKSAWPSEGSNLWTDSGSNIYYNDGNVGIGTVSPGYNLEIYGTDVVAMVHYNGNSRGGIQALGSPNRGVALMTTASGDDLLFGYSDSTPTSADFVPRMFIDNGTGNIGIGTTNPSEKLHVDGAFGYFTGVVVDDAASGKNLIPNWQMESDTYWADAPEQASVADFNGVNHYAHRSDETDTGCYNWAQTASIPADPNKLYKFSIWIKSSDLSMANYFGFYVYDSNGTRITGDWNNPYFKTGRDDLNSWKKWTAYLGPSYSGGATGCDSGKTNGNDYCMAANTAYIRMRIGACYGNGGSNGYSWFMYPKIEEIDPDDSYFVGNTVFMDGNVGIGTTSPDEKLTFPYNATIGWEYSSSDSNAYHYIRKTSNGAGPLDFFGSWTSGSSALFTFTGKPGGTETTLMTIRNDGNVGIGTTNPSATLHVLSGTTNFKFTNSAFIFDRGTSDQWPVLVQENGTNAGGIFWDASENDMIFYTGGSSSGNARMTIDGAGNVGIGNTSPGQKLQVSGNIVIQAGGYLDDDSTMGEAGDDWIRLNGYIELHSSTDSYGIVLRDKDSSSYYLGLTQVGGYSYLTDSNPYTSYFLRANGGSARIRLDLEVGDDLIVTDDITAGGYIKPFVGSTAPMTCTSAYRGALYFDTLGGLCGCHLSGTYRWCSYFKNVGGVRCGTANDCWW